MKRILLWLSGSALALAIFFPSTSQALNISSVVVGVGNVTWCNTGAGCVNQIWNLGGGGTTLNNTQTLILAQDQVVTPGVTPPAFNFDSSERGATINTGSSPPQGTACSGANPCATTLSINGVNITLGGSNLNALADFNTDTNNTPTGPTHNEAANWNGFVGQQLIGGQIVTVWFGYADSAHSDGCSTSGHDPDNNCLPFTAGVSGIQNIWDGTGGSTAATFFFGNKAEFTSGAPGCVRTTAPDVGGPCWDSGAILIQVTNPTVPEPASLLLLGTGLLGLIAWLRKHQLS